jgi:hypothetical protein
MSRSPVHGLSRWLRSLLLLSGLNIVSAIKEVCFTGRVSKGAVLPQHAAGNVLKRGLLQLVKPPKPLNTLDRFPPRGARVDHSNKFCMCICCT